MPRPAARSSHARSASHIADVVVLDGLSLTVAPGDRSASSGRTGSASRRCCALLAGLEQPDDGVVSREPGRSPIAYFAQECDGRRPLRRRGGAAAARGAPRGRTPTSLLLDEPTNDLDGAALELLERFVDRHRGAPRRVSHDRAVPRADERASSSSRPRRGACASTRAAGASYEPERARARERHEAGYRGFAERRSRVEEQARRMREWEQRGYGQGRKKKKGKDVGASRSSASSSGSPRSRSRGRRGGSSSSSSPAPARGRRRRAARGRRRRARRVRPRAASTSSCGAGSGSRSPAERHRASRRSARCAHRPAAARAQGSAGSGRGRCSASSPQAARTASPVGCRSLECVRGRDRPRRRARRARCSPGSRSAPTTSSRPRALALARRAEPRPRLRRARGARRQGTLVLDEPTNHPRPRGDRAARGGPRRGSEGTVVARLARPPLPRGVRADGVCSRSRSSSRSARKTASLNVG